MKKLFNIGLLFILAATLSAATINIPADYSTIQVTRDIPVPAIVEDLVGEEDLYYIKLNWSVSAYDYPGTGSNPPPEGYDGELQLADQYIVYRDSEEYAVVESEYLFFVDDNLTPQEEYLDINDNGLYDDGEDFTDENYNGIWDSMIKFCN